MLVAAFIVSLLFNIMLVACFWTVQRWEISTNSVYRHATIELYEGPWYKRVLECIVHKTCDALNYFDIPIPSTEYVTVGYYFCDKFCAHVILDRDEKEHKHSLDILYTDLPEEDRHGGDSDEEDLADVLGKQDQHYQSVIAFYHSKFLMNSEKWNQLAHRLEVKD